LVRLPCPTPGSSCWGTGQPSGSSPPVVTTGPRQSGKTTLLRRLYGGRIPLISLEPPDVVGPSLKKRRATGHSMSTSMSKVLIHQADQGRLLRKELDHIRTAADLAVQAFLGQLEKRTPNPLRP
jgi:hypothetical protein